MRRFKELGTRFGITLGISDTGVVSSVATPQLDTQEEKDVVFAHISAGENEAVLKEAVMMAAHSGKTVLIIDSPPCQNFAFEREPMKLTARDLPCITTVKNPFEIPNNRKGRRMKMFAKNKRRFFDEVMRKPKYF